MVGKITNVGVRHLYREMVPILRCERNALKKEIFSKSIIGRGSDIGRSGALLGLLGGAIIGGVGLYKKGIIAGGAGICLGGFLGSAIGYGLGIGVGFAFYGAKILSIAAYRRAAFPFIYMHSRFLSSNLDLQLSVNDAAKQIPGRIKTWQEWNPRKPIYETESYTTYEDTGGYELDGSSPARRMVTVHETSLVGYGGHETRYAEDDILSTAKWLGSFSLRKRERILFKLEESLASNAAVLHEENLASLILGKLRDAHIPI